MRGEARVIDKIFLRVGPNWIRILNFILYIRKFRSLSEYISFDSIYQSATLREKCAWESSQSRVMYFTKQSSVGLG